MLPPAPISTEPSEVNVTRGTVSPVMPALHIFVPVTALAKFPAENEIFDDDIAAPAAIFALVMLPLKALYIAEKF